MTKTLAADSCRSNAGASEIPRRSDQASARSRGGRAIAALGFLGILTIGAATLGGCQDDLVWPADATQAVLVQGQGGEAPPLPPGSTCGYGEATFTFTVAPGRLAWHLCDDGQASAGAPLRFVDGARALAADETRRMVAGLQAVVPSDRMICGADKPTLSLTVTRPAGTTTYLDDFYSCEKKGVYVDSLDPVFATARELAAKN